MTNINEKESVAESDLEEGEIPEFEICQNANSDVEHLIEDGRNQPAKKIHPGCTPDFGRVKDNPPSVHIQNSSQGCLKKPLIYFPSEKGRYELPSVEVEYVPEKSKMVMRNQVPQNTIYDYNIVERRLKYLHPFQTTYGSVEHIMTKIGETLGRSNDGYYKERRSSDAKSLINLNNNIGATVRESDSLFRRFRNNYRRKRYSKNDSDSDRDIWETSGKLKSRSSVDLRRKEEKDFRKKRKSKHSNAHATGSETKKSRLPGKSSRTSGDENVESVKSTFHGNERLLKAIREIQEREKRKAAGREMPFADKGSNATLKSPSPLLSEKDVEKPAVITCDTINAADDNQENRNYEDLSEKYSVNDEDSDEDIELIKLRLLALTSNKRKNQVLDEEKIKNGDRKPQDNPKSELTDNEKEHENLPAADDMVECKTSQNNDIDRYELLLRAEALTALLKKKHGIKKRKNSSSCSLLVHRDDEDKKVEDPEKQKIEVRVSSAAETKAMEKESLPIQDDICMDVDVSAVTTSNGNSDAISEPHTNSQETLQVGPPPNFKNLDHVDSCDNFASLSQKQNQIGQTDVKGSSPSEAGSKLKRRRLKKNKKFGGLNLNKLSIKENSGMSCVSTDESNKQTRAFLPDSISQKKGLKEHEKKFILVDSSQLSKFQSTCESKLSPSLEQGDKNIGSAKADGVLSATTTAKIPETEMQRIIVHLGSDSSDDEVLTIKNQSKSDADSSELPENVESPSTVTVDAHSKIADYEKSVELLLKDARRRIERNMEQSQKIPPTPEAVYNHLAPSQRLEYIRLKQKIAETEKLRRMKETASPVPAAQESPRKIQFKNFRNRNSPTSEIQKKELTYNKSSSIKNLFLKSNVKDTQAISSKTSNVSNSNNINKRNKIKNSARTAVNEVNNDGINNVKKVEGEGIIRTKNVINANLGAKILSKNGSAANSVSVVKKILERKKTLTQNRLHLERLKILWKNIKMEKMIEDKCMNELKRLKIQQNFFELKISQQRTKIKKLAEESKQIYEAFQKMNKGLEMSAKKKKMIATEKSGPELVDTKVSRTNEKEKCSKIETVGPTDDVHTPSENEGNLVEKIDGIISLEDKDHAMKRSEAALSGTGGEQLKEYNSPLQRNSTGTESSSSQRVDPNTILCQYDLTGKCNDVECPYQHVRC